MRRGIPEGWQVIEGGGKKRDGDENIQPPNLSEVPAEQTDDFENEAEGLDRDKLMRLSSFVNSQNYRYRSKAAELKNTLDLGSSSDLEITRRINSSNEVNWNARPAYFIALYNEVVLRSRLER